MTRARTHANCLASVQAPRIPAVNLREIGHITALRKAMQAYESDLIAGLPHMAGPAYIAVLNAAYDLFEIDAIYDRAGEVRDDLDADQPDERDARPVRVCSEFGLQLEAPDTPVIRAIDALFDAAFSLTPAEQAEVDEAEEAAGRELAMPDGPRFRPSDRATACRAGSRFNRYRKEACNGL